MKDWLPSFFFFLKSKKSDEIFFALLAEDVHNNVQNVFLILNVETEVTITNTIILQTKKN